MTLAEKISFDKLCLEELSREKVRNGIGLLAEKRLHSVLKRWVVDDFSCHEQKITGKGEKPRRFVADVLTKEGEIFEIQTAALFTMKEKIDFYMKETDYKVTVVHPLIAEKWVNWILPESGELQERNRSPKKDSPIGALRELKPFAEYLASPRFSLIFPFISFDEFRLLDGIKKNPKRRSHRYELIPQNLCEVLRLEKREDFLSLFPAPLPSPFTAKTFGQVSHLRGFDLYNVLAVFEGLGVIEKCGKQGRAALWQKTI